MRAYRFSWGAAGFQQALSSSLESRQKEQACRSHCRTAWRSVWPLARRCIVVTFISAMDSSFCCSLGFLFWKSSMRFLMLLPISAKFRYMFCREQQGDVRESHSGRSLGALMCHHASSARDPTQQAALRQAQVLFKTLNQLCYFSSDVACIMP